MVTSGLGLLCFLHVCVQCLSESVATTGTYFPTKPRKKSCKNVGCGQVCNMVKGSPQCSCHNGFQLSDNGKTCLDIDECLEYGPCSQFCTNTNGSFVCNCYHGFLLAANRRFCIEIDECKQQPCEQFCRNTMGSYVCYCERGYRLLVNRRNCSDVDECLEYRPCEHTCANIKGSFACRCRKGFQLAEDQRSCRAVNASTSLCDSEVCGYIFHDPPEAPVPTLELDNEQSFTKRTLTVMMCILISIVSVVVFVLLLLVASLMKKRKMIRQEEENKLSKYDARSYVLNENTAL